MTLYDVARAYDRRQATLARKTAAHAHRLWTKIDPGNIGRSWLEQTSQLMPTLVSAQGIAASSASAYVEDALAAQELTGETLGAVRAESLMGVASDGRGLASLIYRPAISSLQAIEAGSAPARALALGGVHLDMIVRTQIEDASRVATGVAITARPHATGYVRMVSAGACSRCIVLAGKHYRWSAGFLRHPRCACRNVPAAENVSGDVSTNPKRAFDAMSSAEQDRRFTRSGAEAIRSGADIAKVVNSRRGMYVAGERRFTTEASTRRGGRLMPEQIARESAGNREEAIRLLRLHGYIT